MTVQTPSYWQEEKYQPLVEETTAYGNKVLIPQELQCGWEMERLRMEYCKKRSLNPIIGLEQVDSRQIYYDLARTFYEVYHE